MKKINFDDGNLLSDRQEYINVRSKDAFLCCVIDQNFNGIHLAEVILKLWVYMDKTSQMYLYWQLNQDTHCLIAVESKDCIKFPFICVEKYVHYEMGGGGVICTHWNTDYLLETRSSIIHENSTRNPGVLTMTSSEYLNLEFKKVLTS